MTGPAIPTSSELVEGKYQLVGLIGRGGMGSVWEARHVSLGTRFAIKFIESEYADSAEARTRFDREARAAATIQSKHAIQIFDHGVTSDGKPFIVMEFLQGEPLDKRIDRGPLSLQDTARILQQVCRALARAHERGIIHRDLKPENIFLVRTPDDDEEIAKVLDFGIAKIQAGAHDPGISSSTKTGAVLGTPFYMSPEQARGLRNVDHRTDLWSLGVIAYKCVTGKLPFDGESVGDLLVKICTSPVPQPTQIAPHLPSSFDAWFLRALEREPARRFASAQELGDSLAYAAGMTPRASGGGGSQPSPYGAPPGSYVAPHTGGHTAPRTEPGGPPVQAAMTGASFTSSQHVPGVPPGGRAKYFVFAALAGLSLAAVGTVVAMKVQSSKRDGGKQAAITMSAAASVGETPSVASGQPSAPPLAAADAGVTLAAVNHGPEEKPVTAKNDATKPVVAKTADKPVDKPKEPEKLKEPEKPGKPDKTPPLPSPSASSSGGRKPPGPVLPNDPGY